MTTPAPERDLSLQGHYAGFVTRGAAFVLDVLTVLTVFALAGHVIAFLVSSLRGSDFSFSDHRTLSTIMLVVWAFFYGSYSLAVRGRTVGKAVIGLRVVRGDGRDLGPGRAVLRMALFSLSLVLLGISMMLTLLRRDRRALHDLLADTAVVYAWDAPAARLRLLARHGGHDSTWQPRDSAGSVDTEVAS